jgi:hypothetical protein
MHVYVLHLASRAHLERAFGRVLDAPSVVSCAVEPELERLRLVAPRAAAQALLHEIYLEGGLVWCSRHAYRVVAPESWEARASSAPAGSAADSR